jgi:predicted DCC family thiol-disulfide oxidoreductase YuxK
MVILFDGVCNLCNWWVRFILKHDNNKVFKFASLQSKYGTELLAHYNLPSSPLESVLLYDGKELYSHSDAIIRISSKLSSIYKVGIVLKFLPRFIRDPLYRIAAKSRYSIFGKRKECMVPDETMKSRFLDNTPFIPGQQV